MMAMLRWAVMLLIVLVIVGPASAQGRGRSKLQSQVPRYAPQSPTVSPYLALLSRNGTAAGNYFGLVRPLQRQQRINERIVGDVTSQQQELQQLQVKQRTAFDQPTIKPTGTAGWFHDYGQIPPYQRSDHYYSQWDGGGGNAPRGRIGASRVVYLAFPPRWVAEKLI